MASTEETTAAAPELALDELEALQGLVRSEGWAVYRRLVDREWDAEATLRKIDKALALVARGDHEAETETVTQIQVARREVVKVLHLPFDRIAQLTPDKKKPGRFDPFRRVHR